MRKREDGKMGRGEEERTGIGDRRGSGRVSDSGSRMQDPGFEIREESVEKIKELARISISFEVNRVLDLMPVRTGLGGLTLTERALPVPFQKDYDSIESNGPMEWAKSFDVSNWGLITAFTDGQRIGAALVAVDTIGVTMFDGRRDLAVLWDIWVAPCFRKRGVGTALFRAALKWASARRCRQLKVATQNNNVAACRFYSQQGCVLGAIIRFAYPKFPEEIQLLWYMDIPLASAVGA